MAWVAQADIPWAIVVGLNFSPIIGAEVYIIDLGQNFYRFNISTQLYTALAPTPYIGTSLNRSLTYRNGFLYCIDEGAVGEPRGRRISWYNIATGVWASSSQVNVAGNYRNIRALCFQDDDTIWAWVKQNANIDYKCMRYVISTDTWTGFPNVTGVIGIGAPTEAIMNAAGNQVFGANMADIGGPGLSPGRYGIYTIATDTYTFSPFIVPGPISFCSCADPLRLWFYQPAPGAPGLARYGYLENDGVTEVHLYWTANAARAAGWTGSFGVSDLDAIIDMADNVNPMTYFDGFIVPAVQTDAATSIVNNSAQLNATLDTGGLICQCRFEWGETIAYGNITPIQAIAVGLLAFASTIGSLKSNTTYHFRAIATNALGTSTGADRSFTTSQVPHYPSTILPEVDTRPATLITEHTDRLNGIVIEDNGVIGATRFQWGLSTNYGNNTSWEQGYNKGDEFFVDLNNLAEGQAFHFRAQYRNQGTIYNGRDMVFNTLSPLGPVTLVTDEIINLLGAVA